MSEAAVKPDPPVPAEGDRVRIVVEGYVRRVDNLHRYAVVQSDPLGGDEPWTAWDVPIRGPIVRDVTILAKPLCATTLNYEGPEGKGFTVGCQQYRGHNGSHASIGYTWTT